MRIYSIKCYLDISFLAIIIIFLAKSVLLVVFYLSNI
jgi:hypothetical protein